MDFGWPMISDGYGHIGIELHLSREGKLASQ